MDIKFRGMDLNGNWHYGLLAECKVRHRSIEKGFYISNDAGMPFAYQVRPETVGQFTGLQDRNGVDIYDGDIIEVPDNWDEYGFMSGEKRAVYFNAGGFRLKPLYEKSKGYWLDDGEEIKVIGNIHQHPELLKGEYNE